MRRLFVRSGGGMPGIDIHCGIWQALEARGIRADACIGTSAGAIVSAMDAAGMTAARAADIVGALSDQDVRQERFLWKLRLAWIDYWLEHAPIERLIADLMPTTFSGLAKPLRVACTRVEDGGKVIFNQETGDADLRAAILASMSISGVFPWVQIQGEWYADGGTRANLPMPEDWHIYDEVWLLIATRPTFYRTTKRGIPARLMLNADWLMADQIMDVIGWAGAHPRCRIVWPACGATSGSLRFNHGLIATAREQTEAILATRDL